MSSSQFTRGGQSTKAVGAQDSERMKIVSYRSIDEGDLPYSRGEGGREWIDDAHSLVING